MQPSHVAGRVVGQALDSKSSVTELCLAYNELGIKGAMLAMRKAGSDVQGVNGQCGETNMACIFCVFTQTAKRPTSCAGVIGCPGYLVTACHCKILRFRCSEWTWGQWPLLSLICGSSGHQQIKDNAQAFQESPCTFASNA